MLGKVRAQAKGLIGEAEVGTVLSNLQNKYEFEMFHNLPVPYGDSDTQIDFVIVSKKGFYVLEVKNWSGVINCSEKDRYWRVLYLDEIYRANPIIQNDYHIKKLSAITKSEYVNIVLLPDSTQILNRCKHVWRYSDLKYIFTHVKDIYTSEEVRSECRKLTRLKESSDISRLAKSIVKSKTFRLEDD